MALTSLCAPGHHCVTHEQEQHKGPNLAPHIFSNCIPNILAIPNIFLHVQALKAASQQTYASPNPIHITSVDPLPPQGTPGQPAPPPQEVTPAKHTPSAEQVAILALTGTSKAAAREASVTLLLQEQQPQPQLQEQPPQQYLSISPSEDGGKSSVLVSEQQHMGASDETLPSIHRQLSEESHAESVSEETQSVLSSIQVCLCPLLLCTRGNSSLFFILDAFASTPS